MRQAEELSQIVASIIRGGAAQNVMGAPFDCRDEASDGRSSRKQHVSRLGCAGTSGRSTGASLRAARVTVLALRAVSGTLPTGVRQRDGD
jgi:hypothetical protein